MTKKRILLSALLLMVFMFALGVSVAGAEDVTWNPDDKDSSVILSDGNLTASNILYEGLVRANVGKYSGKWYWECTVHNAYATFVGVADASVPTTAEFWYINGVKALYALNGDLYYPHKISYTNGLADGTIVSVLLDLDNGHMEFWKNGTSLGVAYTDLKSLGTVYPMAGSGSTWKPAIVTANFGATSFQYPIPEGYLPYNGVTIQVPTNLTATAGDAQVDLSWEAVEGAIGYNVKRATTSGGPYQTVAESVYQNNYTDTGLANGTTYYYIVTAVTASGESDNSNEASGIPQQGVTPPTGNGTLVVTVENGPDREYNLTMAQIQAFIDWYNNRSTGGNVYIIEKTAIAPYTGVKDYLIFDKIVAWQVKQY